MKKTILVILTAVVLTAAAFAQAQPVKIGYVDLERVLDASKERQTAESVFGKEAQEMQKQIETEYKNLMTLNQQLQEQAAFLSNEEGKKKQDELMEKQKAFNQMRNEMSAKLERRQAELMKPIIDKVKSVVNNIRKEKKYDFIFEKSAIISVDDSFDITDMVIERINR